MEWYEIQTAYEISQKVFSTGPINNSPKTALLIKDVCDFFQLAEKIRFSDSGENIEEFAERVRDLFKSWTSLLQAKYAHLPSGSLSDLFPQQKVS